MEWHPDWCAAWDWSLIGAYDVGVSRSKSARWLSRDMVLGMFEANSEKYMAISMTSAYAMGSVKWVDFQLKHPRRQNLKCEERVALVTVRKIWMPLLNRHLKVDRPTYHLHEGQSQEASKGYTGHFSQVFGLQLHNNPQVYAFVVSNK